MIQINLRNGDKTKSSILIRGFTFGVNHLLMLHGKQYSHRGRNKELKVGWK